MYTITEMAKRHDTTLRSLRFYEEKGLLAPQRDDAKRLYSEADSERIGLIRLWGQAGFSIEAIRGLLNAHDSADPTALPLALAAGLPALDEQLERRRRAIAIIRSTLGA